MTANGMDRVARHRCGELCVLCFTGEVRTGQDRSRLIKTGRRSASRRSNRFGLGETVLGCGAPGQRRRKLAGRRLGQHCCWFRVDGRDGPGWYDVGIGVSVCAPVWEGQRSGWDRRIVCERLMAGASVVGDWRQGRVDGGRVGGAGRWTGWSCSSAIQDSPVDKKESSRDNGQTAREWHDAGEVGGSVCVEGGRELELVCRRPGKKTA